MTSNPGQIPRYAATFRQNELKLICDCARRGQSICLVGVAGSGKSNIVNFLHSDPYHYRAHYLGEMNTKVHFPVVVGNTWNGTALNLWELLATALREIELPEVQALLPIAEKPNEEVIFAGVKAALKQLCQQRDERVMIILDDADELLRHGPAAMLEHLLAIRNDGNRDRLSYLLFVKQPPHLLGNKYGLGKSKFYDLFSSHIFSLGLYEKPELDQMLLYMNSGDPEPLRRAEMDLVAIYSGGHAHLARLLFNLWKTEHPAADISNTNLAGRADIENECKRILLNLHPDEQAVALRFARNQHTSYDGRILEHLTTRGLITDVRKGQWFTPLMGEFLQNYRAG